MSAGIFVLTLYIIAIMHMHYRGRVRFSVARQFLTHTNYLAPYNLLVNLFSRVPNTPYIVGDPIDELNILRDNWETIRIEALALSNDGEIKVADSLNDMGFNSFFKTGWSRFYLKWYGAPLASAAELCPKTVDLLSRVPSVKGAMFASLPPGGILKPHRDPFAGSLRYHLGLSTPNDNGCFILVDGEKYVWADGKSVLFDETYIHEAHNLTNHNRIILFCDVTRPLCFKPLALFNTYIGGALMRASATSNKDGDPVGLINRSFHKLYSLRVYSKKLKKWNKTVYKILKYVLYILFVYLVFL